MTTSEKTSNVSPLLLLIAFAIAVIPSALWAALDWNSHEFGNYLDNKITFGNFLSLLYARFVFVYIVCLILSFLIGIPAYYSLRKLIAFKLPVVCLVSVLIAIAPNVFIEIASLFSESTGYFKLGDCVHYIDNQRTECGWKYFWLENILLVAAKGVLAGFIFWLILRKRFLLDSTKHFA